ncbi:class I SAM-dependent methyltransferase [Spirulina subsalsa FACHB-351]|uniref:Class I SAM-dependent methyltransferase n=1 Tax=Spirulina subsalsa FACHB-351 TaxID=234711 RepID=A0ABT3L717_9CYAN|nr:class I SAM-dependent methyltransferase [Spirulina subsalsa]MCW6037306.1 class I SAM-dependent methyltransferase [Spirulina subsalsa FACHB-351]
MINPKDIIKNVSVEELCKTADLYFKSIQNPIPQMGKPFSSIIEAPELLCNMGNLLSGLHLGKTMTVLEFAAGTCWFSRYLNQLQCQTICCDASATALEIGKKLFLDYPIIGELISEPQFLHFDGHRIDLPTESVDRIVCHDGFHHIPNQDEVISELGRVLKTGGIAGFSEPGRIHSQSPQSQYEMKNYKVLENDIIISEIFPIALKHGFTDIRLHLFNNIEISLDDYESLNNSNRELENKILENARQIMLHRTIFFLYKGEFFPDSRSHIGLAHCITLEKENFNVRKGEPAKIFLKITNIGQAIWLHENINDIGVVKIGTHLYDEEDNLINLDFSRHCFDRNIKPHETIEKSIVVKFDKSGVFKVTIDLVSESICWFENIGSKSKTVTITVI